MTDLGKPGEESNADPNAGPNAGAGAADTAVADGDDSHSAPLFVGLAPVVLLLSGVLAVVYARRHKAP